MSYDEEIPESMLGCILAFEGINGAQTIVNGPTGCKYQPASQSESLYPRGTAYNPFRYMNEFYFSQPRVPCTYMDSDDLILGTDEKLVRLGEMVLEEKPNLLGIINSPGAALIGADLDVVKDEGTPIIRMDSPGYSESFGEGFQRSVISVLERLCPERKEKKTKKVNILGITIRDLSWMDDEDEIMDILSKCGLEVISFVCAGCTVDELRESVTADLNIVLHRGQGRRIAEWYEERHGIPFIDPDIGAPIGFDNLERWVKEIAERTDSDAEGVMKDILLARRRAANEIKGVNAYSNIPSGCTFSIYGKGSVVYPVTRTLYEYLGMIPVSIRITDLSFVRETEEFCSSHDLTVSDDPFDTEADLFYGTGTMCADLMFRGLIGQYVNIEVPKMERASIRKRPFMGTGGTLNLLDETINALDRI